MRDFKDYLKAIFIEGGSKVLTLFDLLGIGLFLSPQLARAIVGDATTVRIIAAFVLALSFMAANFKMFRTYRIDLPALDETSLAMNLYTTGPYNAVELRYFGREPARDLSVETIYKSPADDTVREVVTEFFPSTDRRMTWTHSRVNGLYPNQVVYFRLVRSEATLDGRALVVASFVGAHSRTRVASTQEFELIA